MKAAVLTAQGPPSVLQIQQGYPPPQRRPGEVLVRVAAASVNPVDVKTRSGVVPRLVTAIPRILGSDVAGVVEAADEGSPFRKGDRVFGCTGQHIFNSRYGTYAELVSASEDAFEKIPDGVGYEEAAAVPLAAMTAWQALEARMPLEGKAVLVHAGSGGVGTFAIQIAKALGARVTATCGPSNVALVTQTLGADVAVDYTKDRFDDVAPGPYDVIVDLIGGDYETRGVKLLKRRGKGEPGGHYTNLLTHGWNKKYGPGLGGAITLLSAARGTLLSALGLGPSYELVTIQAKASRGLQQVAALMAEGKVKPLIDRVLPLEQVAEAHAHSEGGHARGKIVLRVAEL
ncbi:NADPH2:quinone reductase [Monoraphidium neglectum]|uniref:NADPH2:quinone reductase n=1 Tax=Monoraphidium neglectum TaxID=145388 RepID=A0A0D2MSZ7_9CHLO|nr:NADPH2:quinone reductase [Monoraphidium neglectum]KIZ03562.1 NADPH2:quinone reductase [Monoraphidium neglectum]|eukprot:XP_013902581.1 NADPH2:quinone reductase [Monoraphidium neglectum]